MASPRIIYPIDKKIIKSQFKSDNLEQQWPYSIEKDDCMHNFNKDQGT